MSVVGHFDSESLEQLTTMVLAEDKVRVFSKGTCDAKKYFELNLAAELTLHIADLFHFFHARLLWHLSAVKSTKTSNHEIALEKNNKFVYLHLAHMG